MGTTGAGSKHRLETGTRVLKPFSHRGAWPEPDPGWSRALQEALGPQSAWGGLGEARSVCWPPARQGRCPLPQGISSRIRTLGWEMFCKGQSVGSDGAQTTSAPRSRAGVPPAQQEPGLSARSSQQGPAGCPATAAATCPSALAAPHGPAGIISSIINCYFPRQLGAGRGSGLGAMRAEPQHAAPARQGSVPRPCSPHSGAARCPSAQVWGACSQPPVPGRAEIPLGDYRPQTAPGPATAALQPPRCGCSESVCSWGPRTLTAAHPRQNLGLKSLERGLVPKGPALFLGS